MSGKHLKTAALLGVVLAGLSLAPPVRATGTVHAGWDLLQTDAGGTVFLGRPWMGVPLGSYDFGGGPEPTGLTDTIVERKTDAHAPSEAIPIELVALQLKSVAPIDLGGGLATHYITLQSVRGGPGSPGRMTIDFGPEGNPHGTFSSFFDVFFDVRLGGLTGPILMADNLQLSNQGALWSHEAPPGALLIDGVNHMLNGADILQDFWPGPIQEVHPAGAMHTAGPTPGNGHPIPDVGGTLALFLASCAGIIGLRRRLTP